MSNSRYFDNVTGKKALTRNHVLCEMDPEFFRGETTLNKKIFPRQDVYLLIEPGYPGSLAEKCADNPVSIPVGTEVEIKEIIYENYFDGQWTLGFGHINHPTKNQKVAFRIHLSSRSRAVCGDPNAPFNLTRKECQEYFDNLELPWN